VSFALGNRSAQFQTTIRISISSGFRRRIVTAHTASDGQSMILLGPSNSEYGHADMLKVLPILFSPGNRGYHGAIVPLRARMAGSPVALAETSGSVEVIGGLVQ
jgi:hypothetical protein